MAKKRGNPNWGKPEVNSVPYTGTNSFEEVVKKLRLLPSEYEGSIHLQEWAKSGRKKTKIRNTYHRTCYSHGAWM